MPKQTPPSPPTPANQARGHPATPPTPTPPAPTPTPTPATPTPSPSAQPRLPAPPPTTAQAVADHIKRYGAPGIPPAPQHGAGAHGHKGADTGLQLLPDCRWTSPELGWTYDLSPLRAAGEFEVTLSGTRLPLPSTH